MPSEICWKDWRSSSHHAGTMRVGTSPINSVIDENLKVHSKKNIYVCDLSIFQDLVIQTQLIHFQPTKKIVHININTSHDKHSIWLLTLFTFCHLFLL